MKTSLFAAVLVAFAAPALAQSTTPAQPQTPPAQSGSQMPMGQMMPGQGMPGPGMMGQGRMDQGMMGQGMMQGRGMMGGMMQGQGRGMMGRFSPEDMGAFMDAHIAALKAGLKLSAEQEKLWPPVESAIRDLASLHLSHRHVMRQTRGMMASDPVGLLRGMADHMSQGADAMRKLADAAAPLYATLDEGQKRRLQVLVRMGGRGMMGGAMMRGGSVDDGDDDESGDDNR